MISVLSLSLFLPSYFIHILFDNCQTKKTSSFPRASNFDFQILKSNAELLRLEDSVCRSRLLSLSLTHSPLSSTLQCLCLNCFKFLSKFNEPSSFLESESRYKSLTLMRARERERASERK